MFTLYQKRQLIYPNEVNSTPIRDMSRDHNQGTVRRPQDFVLGKKIHIFLGILGRDIAYQSYAPNEVLNTPLTRKCIYSPSVAFFPL